MAHPKMAPLIVKLRERTAAGSVAWEPTTRKDVFQASFPGYSVKISQEPSPSHAGLDVKVSIFNEEGALVDEVRDEELRDALPASFQLLIELYEMARGKAMGVDGAIDSILGELTKDEIAF